MGLVVRLRRRRDQECVPYGYSCCCMIGSIPLVAMRLRRRRDHDGEGFRREHGHDEEVFHSFFSSCPLLR